MANSAIILMNVHQKFWWKSTSVGFFLMDFWWRWDGICKNSILYRAVHKYGSSCHASASFSTLRRRKNLWLAAFESWESLLHTSQILEPSDKYCEFETIFREKKHTCTHTHEPETFSMSSLCCLLCWPLTTIFLVSIFPGFCRLFRSKTPGQRG